MFYLVACGHGISRADETNWTQLAIAMRCGARECSGDLEAMAPAGGDILAKSHSSRSSRKRWNEPDAVAALKEFQPDGDQGMEIAQGTQSGQ